MVSRFTDWLDDKPTWFKVVLWTTFSGLVDGIYNAFTGGSFKVDPVMVPIINVLLVALRDFARSKTQGGSTP